MSIGSMMGQARMEVHGPSAVSAGQPFQISFSVNARAKGFTMPSLKGLNLISGPGTSSNSSISIINGNMTQSVTTTFTIVVSAEREGTANVGVASCTVDGQKVQSSPVSIRVDKADPNRQSANQRQNQGGWGQQSPRQAPSSQPAATAINDETLFARASLNKSNLYRGEEAIIVYKIYTQVPVTQFMIEKLPRNKGFWSEDLSENMTQVKQYDETYNGRQYHVAEIRRGALYPQETGTLTIAPLQTEVLALVQTQRQRTGTIFDFFIDDPFFSGMSQQTVAKTLTSNGLNVNVKPLPEAPEGYAGGVGQFEVKAKTDISELRANEAFVYSVTVKGRGNLSLLDAPQITFPKGLEVYEPTVTDNINKGDYGLSGSRTFEWVVIPQVAGDYIIPELNYVYFDPSAGQYVAKRCGSIKVKVHKGASGSSSKSDVTELNSDIHHIKKQATLRPAGSAGQATWLFWVLMSLPVVAGGAVVLAVRRQQHIAGDESSLRLQRATKMAKKRLRNAERYLHQGDDVRFYEEIYKALWGGIADKFDIQQSLLSSETVQRYLAERHVDSALQERIMKTLADVDFARFAPGDSSAKKQAIYDEAMVTITKIADIKVKLKGER